MNWPLPQVLYEDNHLLALNKPAGLPTMGTPDGQPTLLTVAKAYIKEKYHKPGDVYLGVMSRLDAPVTGVVILARTSKAAARLTEQFREHTVEKRYWVLVEGILEPQEGRCVDWLAPDERHRRMRIVGPQFPGAKEARLSYRRLLLVGRNSMAEVELETGRKHQIRLQLAQRGYPIVGDRKYEGRQAFRSGIALHSRRIVVIHPVRAEPIVIEAPLPGSWPSACGFG